MEAYILFPLLCCWSIQVTLLKWAGLIDSQPWLVYGRLSDNTSGITCLLIWFAEVEPSCRLEDSCRHQNYPFCVNSRHISKCRLKIIWAQKSTCGWLWPCVCMQCKATIPTGRVQGHWFGVCRQSWSATSLTTYYCVAKAPNKANVVTPDLIAFTKWRLLKSSKNK